MPLDSTAYFPSDDEVAEYERNLAKIRLEAVVHEEVVVQGRKVVWSPLKGSQESFLQCPLFEVLFHGNRGPGKTDGLLMAFAQHVGRGHGGAWRGIIFRQTYPQLADVVAKSQKWFPRIFGKSARFNKAEMSWSWDSGEVLYLRHIATVSDYWKYHGHEYPFIGFEELTSWATDECYLRMMSCCRSSTPGVPLMVRATTNPYGVGHNWVKARFRLDGEWWKTIIQLQPVSIDGDALPPRAAIYGNVRENTILLAAVPDYVQKVRAAADNPAMAAAWIHGDWSIVAGGMFDDLWTPSVHIVAPFEIPHSWIIDRSFDWGASSPFSVGWWAESDGSDVALPDGSVRATVRGDLFRIGEWYGWNGTANKGLNLVSTEIAKGVLEREAAMGLRGRVRAGPADTQIYTDIEGGSIAEDMAEAGVEWVHADKSAGTRKQGWQQMRVAFKNSMPPKDRVPREKPGIFVFNSCDQFIRTITTLARDEKDLDDIDDRSEDHIADEARYRLRFSKIRTGSGRLTGLTH